MPWWAYGPQGMQLWFPSSLSAPLSPGPAPPGGTPGPQHKDIELEFDQVGGGQPGWGGRSECMAGGSEWNT